MSHELYKKYRSILARASQLQVIVDFTNDFEEWFTNQLGQVDENIDRLEVKDPFLIEKIHNDEDANLIEAGNDKKPENINKQI
jgi:hypothetical protein